MSELGFRKFVNVLAFIAFIICAILIVISKWVPILGEVAGWVALGVTAICSFLFVKAKRNPVYLLFFLIAIGLIVGFKIWILI